MDIGLYKRARGVVQKTAMPFYPRSPAAAVTPATPAYQAGKNKAKPAAATAPWPLTPVPPPGVVTVQVEAGNGMHCGGDADVDRRAALYISRVQERLRRERMHER